MSTTRHSDSPNSWNLLITGASGFMGRHLTTYGVKARFSTVTAVSRQRPKGLPQEVAFIKLTNDFNKLQENIRETLNLRLPTLAVIATGSWTGSTSSLIEANLTVPLLLTEKLAGIMPCGGVIVFMGDARTMHPLREGAPGYYAAKAGLEGAARSLALHLAPDIRVNVIAPGPLNVIGSGDGISEKWESRTLTGRLGGAQSIISTLEYLRTNDFVTGAVLRVDGGFSLC